MYLFQQLISNSFQFFLRHIKKGRVTPALIRFLVIHTQNLVDVVLIENSLSPVDCLDAALDF